MSEAKVQIAARVSKSIAAKVDAAAARLRTDRSTVLRWVLEEMPAGFVPRQFSALGAIPRAPGKRFEEEDLKELVALDSKLRKGKR